MEKEKIVESISAIDEVVKNPLLVFTKLFQHEEYKVSEVQFNRLYQLISDDYDIHRIIKKSIEQVLKTKTKNQYFVEVGAPSSVSIYVEGLSEPSNSFTDLENKYAKKNKILEIDLYNRCFYFIRDDLNMYAKIANETPSKKAIELDPFWVEISEHLNLTLIDRIYFFKNDIKKFGCKMILKDLYGSFKLKKEMVQQAYNREIESYQEKIKREEQHYQRSMQKYAFYEKAFPSYKEKINAMYQELVSILTEYGLSASYIE